MRYFSLLLIDEVDEVVCYFINQKNTDFLFQPEYCFIWKPHNLFITVRRYS